MEILIIIAGATVGWVVSEFVGTGLTKRPVPIGLNVLSAFVGAVWSAYIVL